MCLMKPPGTRLPIVFWQTIEDSSRGIPPSTHLVLLVDGNAHLGSETTEAIGPVWPEPDNPPGHAMHEFLLRWSLFAPSTHPANHDGDSPTWFSSGGVPHRLDYVVVPTAWKNCTTTRVLVDFEALQGKLDHLPVLAICHLQHLHSAGAYKAAPARHSIRPGSYCAADDLQAFQHLLSAVVPAPWHVDVDAHYDQWVHDVGKAWKDSVSAEPALAPAISSYPSFTVNCCGTQTVEAIPVRCKKGCCPTSAYGSFLCL